MAPAIIPMKQFRRPSSEPRGAPALRVFIAPRITSRPVDVARRVIVARSRVSYMHSRQHWTHARSREGAGCRAATCEVRPAHTVGGRAVRRGDHTLLVRPHGSHGAARRRRSAAPQSTGVYRRQYTGRGRLRHRTGPTRALESRLCAARREAARAPLGQPGDGRVNHLRRDREILVQRLVGRRAAQYVHV